MEGRGRKEGKGREEGGRMEGGGRKEGGGIEGEGREEGGFEEEGEGEWRRVEGHRSFISKAICEEFEDGIVRVTAASMDSCISITEFQIRKQEINGKRGEEGGRREEGGKKEEEGGRRKEEGEKREEKRKKREEEEGRSEEKEGRTEEGGRREEGGKRECFWNIKFEEGRGFVVKAENLRKINDEGVGSLMLAGKNLIACCYDGCVSVWEMERK